ncbi:HAD domain-containing protein [Streptomyces sp. 769]|uniref:HAD domain-containing protein n=1 Tax=Streptomyces sp. 769 TaxID=1262452 RepID=UPI00057DAD28|nr:HAD domain-containing protein [Streptomyces sp. 769]
MRPVLLVDVDGPLNPYAAKPQRRPDGYQTHRLLTPRWEAAQRRRLTDWGLTDGRIKPLRVWLNPHHGPALLALPFDLVWATTWEQEANDFIAPALGLPTLPFVPWRSPRPEPAGDVFWKTPEIVAWARGRAFAWVDDEITDADRAWVAEHHHGPALLRRTDPRVGLTAEDFAVLGAWATDLG